MEYAKGEELRVERMVTALPEEPQVKQLEESPPLPPLPPLHNLLPNAKHLL